MKKTVFIAGVVVFIMTFYVTGCSSSSGPTVPPIYYDYGYHFDEKSYSERYHNNKLIYDRNSVEHKHEYIKFDYRTR